MNGEESEARSMPRHVHISGICAPDCPRCAEKDDSKDNSMDLNYQSAKQWLEDLKIGATSGVVASYAALLLSKLP